MKDSALPDNVLKNRYTLGWKEVWVLVGGFLAGQMLIAVLASLMIFVFRIDFQSSPLFMMVCYILAMVFPILFFDLYRRKTIGEKLNFDFSPEPFFTYLLVFPMMTGMMFISEVATSLVPTTGKIFGPIYSGFVRQMNSVSSENVAMIITTCICAPILEEILFRGIIMKGLLNKGAKPNVAIAVSAFVFGFVHFYPWQFVGAFLLGLVLGVVYYKTKSLLLPILLHAFNNAVASFGIIYFGKENLAEVLKVPPMLLFIIGIILLGVSGYFFLRKYKVSYLENSN